MRTLAPGERPWPDDEALVDLVVVVEGRVTALARGPERRAPLPVPLPVGATLGAEAGPGALCTGLRAEGPGCVLQLATPAWSALEASLPAVGAALADLRRRAHATPACLHGLRRSAVLRHGSLPELAALLQAGRVEAHGALHLVAAAGATLDGLRLVLEGELFARDGRATVRLLGHGEVVGDLELVSGRPLPVDLVAGPRGVHLLAVPEAAVAELIRARPALLRAILASPYGDATQRAAFHARVFAAEGAPGDVVLLHGDRPGLPLPALALATARSLRRQFRDRVAVVLPAPAGEVRPPLRDEDGVVVAHAPSDRPPSAWPPLRRALAAADLTLLVPADPSGPWATDARRAVLVQAEAWQGTPPADLPTQVVGLVPARRPGGPLPLAAGRLSRTVVEALARAEAPDPVEVDRLARTITDRRVGVALGGGGALCFAQVLLLRELVEAGLPIDLLSGVSGGSVVGAFFAAQGLPGLEALVEAGPAFARLELWGWLSSAPVARFFDARLGGARLQDLALPFLPVATDIDRGVQVHLLHDSLGAGIRASGAFPGTFGPVQALAAGRDRRLVDGGITNLVADDTCVLEGARVVLAANVVSPPRPRDPRAGWFPRLRARLPPELAGALRTADPRLRLDDVLRAANLLLYAPVDFDTRPVAVRWRAAPAPFSAPDWQKGAEILAWHARDPASCRGRAEALAELRAAVEALRWKRVRKGGGGRVSVALSEGEGSGLAR